MVDAEAPGPNFPDAVRAAEAAERARQAAIKAPPRSPRAKNRPALESWLDSMVRGLVDELGALGQGEREIKINNAALRVGGFLHLGVDRQHAERELFHAAQKNGWVGEEGESHVRWKISRGIDDGARKPLPRPDLEADATVVATKSEPPAKPGGKINAEAKTKAPVANQAASESISEKAKTLRLRPLSSVKSRVPMWAWEYDGKGRIQLGTMSMFAGKPAAGKSTAVRWFAARLSRGELPGVWFGHPVKVAVIMAEEQVDAVVVPGLVAAGADLSNVMTPEIKVGDVEFGFSTEDVGALQEEMLDNEVRAIFIDPIMSTFGGKSDIYRNNEVREKLAPFTRMASAINGIVVGVTHLTKGQIRDVLGGMNGSAAFGEVPRAVFGFAPIEDGNNVFEQVKNSAGIVGLKLNYRLPVELMTADDGQPIDLPRFEITGETEVSISDINTTNDETTDIGVAKDWLKMYLLEHQPMASSQVKADAKRNGDIQPWTLKRAMKELHVRVWSQSAPGKPHMTVWTLPDYNGATH